MRAKKLEMSLFLAILVTLIGPALPGTARAEGIFPDKNLEAAVRQYVFEKKYNDQPITEDDVKTISTIVFKGKKDRKIKDLTGIEKCRALALLDLEGHEIQDVSRLAGLTRLQQLNLAGNQIQDVKPLAGLVKLQYLHLAGNQVKDIGPLAGLKAMNSLYLDGNQIQDLTAIADLEKIWSLYVSGNRIEDLAALKKLKRVSNLDLRGNQLDAKDLESLTHLTELRYLLLDENPIQTIAPLVDMARKDHEKHKRFAPFWNVYLIGCPLDEEGKKQLEELRKLGGRVVVEKKKEKAS